LLTIAGAIILALTFIVPVATASGTGHARSPPFSGRPVVLNFGGSSCGSTTSLINPPQFSVHTGIARLDFNGSTFPCANATPSSLSLSKTVGVRSASITPAHSISNQTAVWNVSYSVHLQALGSSGCPSRMATVEIDAFVVFNLNGGFSFGHGYRSIVYQTITNGTTRMSASGLLLPVYGNTRVPSGSTVHLYNVITVDVRLLSNNAPACSAFAHVSLQSAGHRTTLVSWTLR
jgi:hypothetical protein